MVSLGYCCVAGRAQCRAKTCQLSWYEQVLCDGSIAKAGRSTTCLSSLGLDSRPD